MCRSRARKRFDVDLGGEFIVHSLVRWSALLTGLRGADFWAGRYINQYGFGQLAVPGEWSDGWTK